MEATQTGMDVPRVATSQEESIYLALNAGDHAAIDEMGEDAVHQDQMPPPGIDLEDWVPPAAQFADDYRNAWRRYQTDHESPQGQREDDTVDEVADENG